MFLTKIQADSGDRSAFGSFWFNPVPFNGSGNSVTADASLQLTAVFACIRYLSNSISTLPFTLYEEAANGGKTKLRGHWLYRLLARRPNDFQNPAEWRAMMQGHLSLRGNAFSRIYSNAKGEVTDLIPIHPDRVTVEILTDTNWRYRARNADGTTTVIARQDMFHLKGLSGDGILGYSPIQLARNAIAGAIEAQNYGSRYFANDAAPTGGWIEHPSNFKDKEARMLYRDQWQESQGGANKGKVAVLEYGMKYHAGVAISNGDAQFIESRKYSISDIARLFGVRPHKIGDLERCMPADTLVFTIDGPRRIADVAVGDRVWSFDGQKLVPSNVLHNWQNGTDDILEIRTTNRTVRCNAQHRLLVRRSVERDLEPGEVGGRNVDGCKVRIEWETAYVTAGELEVGDTLVSLDSLPDLGGTTAPNGRALTVGFMEFCGLLAGDGNVLDGAITIARCDHARYMDHYRDVMQAEFTCGGREYPSGEQHHMAKLSGLDVAAIRALAPRIESLSDIARRFNANINTVCTIAHGKVYHPDHAQANIGHAALEEIKIALASRLNVVDIAQQYGVCTSTIHNILGGRSWDVDAAAQTKKSVLLREGGRRTTFSSVSAVAELTALGFGGTSRTKRIPGWVFSLAEPLRLAYLRGIVDSDGSVDKFGRISVSLVNPELVAQIRHLCMSCGVPVTNMLSSVVTPRFPNGNLFTTTMHTFTCSDPGANARIGSHDARYIERLKNAKPFGKKDRHYPRFGGKGFDVEGLSLSRIVAIDSKPAEPVFDIEVEGHHCFIADGVVSHNSTFSNIEQQSIDSVNDDLMPWVVCWEEAIRYNFMDPEDDTLHVEFPIISLLRGDSAARSTYYHNGILDGWLTRNEARLAESYNPLPGLDEPLRPLNMVADTAVEEEEEEEEEEETDIGEALPANAVPDDPAPVPPPKPAPSKTDKPAAAGFFTPDDRLAALASAVAVRVARKEADIVSRAHGAVDPAVALVGAYARHALFVAGALEISAEAAQAYCVGQIALAQASGGMDADDFADIARGRLEKLALLGQTNF